MKGNHELKHNCKAYYFYYIFSFIVSPNLLEIFTENMQNLVFVRRSKNDKKITFYFLGHGTLLDKETFNISFF